MNETGFPIFATKNPKILCLKRTKRVTQIVSQERGSNVTVSLAVNAMRPSIPPFYIFPRKNICSSFLDDAGPGSDGGAHESWWMTKPNLIKFVQYFIRNANTSKDPATFLLLNNHLSHISADTIDLANQKGRLMLSFPPH